jgi:transcriptional regulator with XRE-family HTH domain
MPITVSSCTRPRVLAQPRNECMINPVENKLPQDITRPDPEVMAGRALRRLRISRQWSQDEAAKRMKAYGYDFHQTTIAKIEAAQRPLRVRELADFAALYGVGVQELIYPRAGSLQEIDQEIALQEEHCNTVEQELAVATHVVDSTAEALRHAQNTRERHMTATIVIREQLGQLREQRAKFALWDTEEEPVPDEVGSRLV